MILTPSSSALQKILPALLAVFALTLSNCQRENIPPYSETEELKFRSDQAKDMTNPRADLAFLRYAKFKDKAVTFGAGMQNDVDLAHWGPESLKLQKQGGSLKILNSPKGTALDGKAVLVGMSVPIRKPGSGYWITSNAISMYIAGDEEGPYGQIFDSKSAPLQELHPLKWYPPAPKYRVAADWIPLPPGHSLVMHKTNGGSDWKHNAAGYLDFRLEGRQMRLYVPIAGQQMFIVFRDFTSKSTTYPAGRFLEIPFPSSAFDPTRKFDPAKKTRLALDFNQAINPLCAYNPNATCPIAPPENRLSIEIPAGEKRYHSQE